MKSKLSCDLNQFNQEEWEGEESEEDDMLREEIALVFFKISYCSLLDEMNCLEFSIE